MIDSLSIQHPDLMTLEEVTIQGLFGQFDYGIPLDTEHRVTLICGLNGSGKTTILRLLEALARTDWVYLQKIPFQNLQLRFKEGTLDVVQNNVDDERRSLSLAWTTGRTRIAIEIEPMLRGLMSDALSGDLIAIRHLGTRRIAYEQFKALRLLRAKETKSGREWFEEGFDLWTQDGLNMASLVLEIMGESGGGRGANERISSLLKVLASIPCRLLPATRLREQGGAKDRVLVCSEDLKGQLAKVKDRFTRDSQSLDYAFPKKLLEWARSRRIRTRTDRSVSEARVQVERRYRELVEAGLLQKEQAVVFTESEVKEMEETLGPVFAAHYDNLEQKLGVFGDIYREVSLLIRTVKEFYGETMTVKADYESGLVVTPKNASKPLPVTVMSSGQQHILILAYHLIFEAAPEQLVMIDEPELSLHSAWQDILVERLRDIGKKKNLHFLLATHSSLIYESAKESAVELPGFR